MTNATYANTGAARKNAPQPFPAMAEKGTEQAKQAFEKMTAATTETAALIKNSFSTVVKGAQDYNNKVLEFAQTNTEAAFDFAQKLSNVKAPADFMELSTAHSHKQFETLTAQTKELAALAQQVALAAAEPLRSGVTKAFSQLG